VLSSPFAGLPVITPTPSIRAEAPEKRCCPIEDGR
jgi:hypothetical protein